MVGKELFRVWLPGVPGVARVEWRIEDRGRLLLGGVPGAGEGDSLSNGLLRHGEPRTDIVPKVSSAAEKRRELGMTKVSCGSSTHHT
jgi:hypothetical protein